MLCTRRLLYSNRQAKRDCVVVKKPVQVSMQSVRKSFGALRAGGESTQKYKAVGEMKREVAACSARR
ncbi:hypothetical protein GN958_ATG22319 [Phytophthora infestans]|uniref:Uncharacterized protein n=1 Tax=Phytophthora infestans TaxID=4787 RepID=A0A8S9TPM6_PHYIN|nr:hypothetical protein GN958_ATG22319 [Phytophthora infestans]